MAATLIVLVLIAGYSIWVLRRKLRKKKQLWKNGCDGNCGSCGGCESGVENR